MTKPAITIYSLLFCIGAQAQSVSEAQVRALILSPGEREMKVSIRSSESGTVTEPFFIGNLGLSSPIKVSGRKLLIVIQDKSKETGYRSIGDASLPAEGAEFILLLEPAGETFLTHVVSGRMPGFGRGNTLFFNATKSPLGVALGKNKIMVPPKLPVAGGPSAKGEDNWYQVTFFKPGEGGVATTFGDTRWPYRDHARAYVFFYPKGSFNGVSYHVVDETLSKVQKE